MQSKAFVRAEVLGAAPVKPSDAALNIRFFVERSRHVSADAEVSLKKAVEVLNELALRIEGPFVKKKKKKKETKDKGQKVKRVKLRKRQTGQAADAVEARAAAVAKPQGRGDGIIKTEGKKEGKKSKKKQKVRSSIAGASNAAHAAAQAL